MQRRVICPEKVRTLPRRFSWVDQRLAREGHMKEMTPQGGVLYLFLTAVADREGVSWYSAESIRRLTGLTELGEARKCLVRLGLLAYRDPYYQLLELPHEAGVQEMEEPRSCESLSLKEIFARMGGAKPQTGLNEYQLRRELREAFGDD